MATYAELGAMFDDGDLLRRIDVAVIVAADAIRANAGATAEQKKWANLAISATRRESEKALKLALAQNKANTKAQITGASDATLQAAVDSVVSLLTTAA